MSRNESRCIAINHNDSSWRSMSLNSHGSQWGRVKQRGLWEHRPQGFLNLTDFLRSGSERGGYPNGLTETPWARWWHGASGRRRDAVSAAPAAAWLKIRPDIISFDRKSSMSTEHHKHQPTIVVFNGKHISSNDKSLVSTKNSLISTKQENKNSNEHTWTSTSNTSNSTQNRQLRRTILNFNEQYINFNENIYEQSAISSNLC